MDIDWDEYYKFDNEWGDPILEHYAKGCNTQIALMWGSIGDAIGAAKEHHEVCPARV